jgi:anthranilate synthase/aminodeoxychorismate synthase-like glutamine amidotransferase
LGVCLGHQGIVQALGGSVVPAPQIMHGKTSPVRILKAHPLLSGLPNPFTVMRYHSWTVEQASLPPAFEVLADTQAETPETPPLIMALAHRTSPLFGVQFHPESVGTPEGALLLRNFLHLTRVGC